jgi:hypothetical protein
MGKHSPKHVARQLAVQRGGWPTEERTSTAACSEDAPPAALVAKQAGYCRLRAMIPLQRVCTR